MWSDRKNWPDGVTCQRCGAVFTTKGIARHSAACKGRKPKPGRLRLVQPPPSSSEVACKLCGEVCENRRSLSQHLRHRHPQGRKADERLDVVRQVATAHRWILVEDELDCVFAVSSADPIVVIHVRHDGDRLVARCVSRARMPEQAGSVDATAPVALVLDLHCWDDIKVILEGVGR